jgi:arginase family enzyme
VKTTAIFFPFDLFGSGGTGSGAKLLADAFAEMLADNRREKQPTRAAAYQPHVRMRELPFDRPAHYQDWRRRGRDAVRQAWRKDEFLLWVAGNHLGVLPVWDELSGHPESTVVVQFDAHLDIQQHSDCTTELSHGNWLLHVAGRLPRIVAIGHRDLLQLPDAIGKHYHAAFSAPEIAVDPEPAIRQVRRTTRSARRVFIDIDCDCLDPAFFPAVTHPEPFGLTPQQLLRFVDAAWSKRVVAVALSEFDPGRDRNDQSLATLLWLMESILLKRNENANRSVRRGK